MSCNLLSQWLRMESKITKFISKHHVLTLATMGEEGVYCANAFYAFDEQGAALIFTTDISTRHGAQMAVNPRVAASIVLETKVVGRVQGAQITGRVVAANDQDRKLYLSKFPYAVVMELNIWRLEIDFLKLTDNTLGFGKKLIWNRA